MHAMSLTLLGFVVYDAGLTQIAASPTFSAVLFPTLVRVTKPPRPRLTSMLLQAAKAAGGSLDPKPTAAPLALPGATAGTTALSATSTYLSASLLPSLSDYESLTAKARKYPTACCNDDESNQALVDCPPPQTFSSAFGEETLLRFLIVRSKPSVVIVAQATLLAQQDRKELPADANLHSHVRYFLVNKRAIFSCIQTQPPVRVFLCFFRSLLLGYLLFNRCIFSFARFVWPAEQEWPSGRLGFDRDHARYDRQILLAHHKRRHLEHGALARESPPPLTFDLPEPRAGRGAAGGSQAAARAQIRQRHCFLDCRHLR